MGTLSGKFHQNLLKTVGVVAETRLCLRTDGRTHYYSPIRLTSGDNKGGMLGIEDLIFALHAEVLPVAHIPSFSQLNTQGNCILCAGKTVLGWWFLRPTER